MDFHFDPSNHGGFYSVGCYFYNEWNLGNFGRYYPYLNRCLDLKTPGLENNFEGVSLAKLLLEQKPLNRDYIVSESWFQATVIGKNAKLGIMKPNPVNPKRDYREFGDMFFDRINDPLELNNGINDEKNQQKIAKLRAFYADFKTQVSGIGMQEISNKNK